MFIKKPQEARSLKRTLGCFFSWASDKKLTAASPMVGLKGIKVFGKKDKPRERDFTVSEISRMIYAIEALPQQVWRDALTLLMLTGLRLRECLHIHRNEVDLSAMLIWISASG